MEKLIPKNENAGGRVGSGKKIKNQCSNIEVCVRDSSTVGDMK